MKTNIQSLIFTLTLFSALNLQPSTLHAQGTAFTYQGRLNNAGSPANGLYDFRFKLYTDPYGSFQAGASYLTNAVPATNGLFIATIDFGAGIFIGTTNWLEVDVRTNGGGAYTILSPLQNLTPTPYAIFAETASNLSGVVQSGQLSGTYDNAVNLNNAGNSFTGGFTGQFSGNGGGFTNLNAWSLTGNTGMAPGVNFLGTADNQPLELRVNSQRAFRIESTTNTANIIGGWSNNFAAPGAVLVTIAGGGGISIVNGSPNTNSVWSSYGTVSGGIGNQAGTTGDDPSAIRGATVSGGANNTAGAFYSTISGGAQNTIGFSSDYSYIAGGTGNLISGYDSTIGGGQANTIQTNADHSVIGGGYANTIVGSLNLNIYAVIGGGRGNLQQTNTVFGTVAGGVSNIISANTFNVTIGGGSNNVVYGNSGTVAGGANNYSAYDQSTIGGGRFNVAEGISATVAGGYFNYATATDATVGGGYQNAATGYRSTVPGGTDNTAAGDYSFASGRHAKANHQGAFVWADSTDTDFVSTSQDQFLIRATGGVGIGINNPSAALHVFGDDNNGVDAAVKISSGAQTLLLDGNEIDTSSGALFLNFNTPGNVRLADGGGLVGIKRVPAANALEVEGNASKTAAGSWLANSDARIKTDIHPVTNALAKLAQVRPVEFRYTAEYRAQHPSLEDHTYLNVIAQEFQRVFPEAVKNSGEKLANGESILQVDTYPLIIYSTAAIQELKQKFEAQARQLTEKEDRISALEKAVGELKNLLLEQSRPSEAVSTTASSK